eukprot:jgi/Tetstr1/445938/TSEL_033567.t1
MARPSRAARCHLSPVTRVAVPLHPRASRLPIGARASAALRHTTLNPGLGRSAASRRAAASSSPGLRASQGTRRGRPSLACQGSNQDGRQQEDSEDSKAKEQAKRKPEEQESWDPRMVGGDMVMLIATELASERIPLRDQGFMCLVVCSAWVMVASARGDYKHSNLDLDAFAGWFTLAPMLASMQAALYTWVLFAPAVAGLLSYLAARGVVDPAIVEQAEEVSPAVIEVMWGSLLTMTSWRGIYIGLNSML